MACALASSIFSRWAADVRAASTPNSLCPKSADDSLLTALPAATRYACKTASESQQVESVEKAGAVPSDLSVPHLSSFRVTRSLPCGSRPSRAVSEPSPCSNPCPAFCPDIIPASSVAPGDKVLPSCLLFVTCWVSLVPGCPSRPVELLVVGTLVRVSKLHDSLAALPDLFRN